METVGDYAEMFPYSGTMRERFRFLLRYALRAPSTHNTQPWIFRLNEQSIDIFADRSRLLAHIDPDGREMTMSVGALVDHLALAMKCHLLEPTIDLMPDLEKPDLMARVSCLGDAIPTKEDLASFDQVFRRHTYRGPYNGQPVTIDTKRTLETAVNDATAGVVFIEDDVFRIRIASMVRVRSETLLTEPGYRKEAAEWIRSGRHAEDGIPRSALGETSLRLLLSNSGLRSASSGREAQQISKAPALAIICTRDDDPVSWLHAGAAISRLTLAASSLQLRCSFYLQPIHFPAFRIELKETTKALGYPQIVIRLGYAAEGQTTPRRNLDDILVEHYERHATPNGEQSR